MNLKNKLSKQKEQRQNYGYGEHFHGCQMGGCWEMGGKGERMKKYKLVVTEQLWECELLHRDTQEYFNNYVQCQMGKIYWDVSKLYNI